jgi:2-phospho-L-lactate guanylyltransferase
VRTAAILPVKRFAHAKQRLGGSIADPQRERLARAMVSDVLGALACASSIERTIVVTSEPSVASQAGALEALVLADDAQEGQSEAVMIGVARALSERYERVLCVPGDCPALEHAELDLLLGATRDEDRASEAHEREVVIVPDRHGTGTNGLLLTPPDVIVPSFGPGSCARHRALARAAGAVWRLEHPPSLLLDIDTREDLAALRDRLGGAGSSAPRTRAELAALERPPALSVSTARR